MPIRRNDFLFHAGTSKDNDKIFDPFAGSGIVPYIAKNLNRQYLGCEISEEVYNESIMKKMIQSDLTLL